MDKSLPEPPTAVFLHGILGSRKNWGTWVLQFIEMDICILFTSNL